MELVVHNLHTEVRNATPDEHDWIESSLTFEDARMRFIKNYKGDGTIRMYNRLASRFPGGLTKKLVDAARTAGESVTVVDARTCPIQEDPNADLDWLRDYQLEGVDIVCKRTRGILWLPTGSGKTEIAVGLALRLPGTWLFLVHKKDLLNQTAERYEARTGLKAGRIGDGQWDVQKFTVATFQTLFAAIKSSKHARHDEAVDLLRRVQGLIVDEAHTLAADSFWKLSMMTKSAYYRVGMSGTPLARGDKRSMFTVAALGGIIYRIRPQVLIDRGLLARPDIKMVNVDQPEADWLGDKMDKESQFSATWKSEPRTFQGVYGKYIVRSAKRNAAIVEAAKRATKPCLLFVKEIGHGELLSERLTKAGIATEFVFGSTNTHKRAAAIERLIRSEIDVLVCSVIFQEGTDIPELRSIIIASGGKSGIAAVQRVGRGMRMAKGKGSTFEVWDIWDTGRKMLAKHAKARRKAYEDEGYEVKEVDIVQVRKVRKAS